MPFWSRDPLEEASLLRRIPDGSIRAYPVQDHFTWVASDQFAINGRRDEAVQVGGVNIFPTQVRRKLMEHPLVSDAVVRPMMSNPITRLKAFVVPVPGVSGAALRTELVRWTELHLPALERPKAFAFGRELPTNAHGKLCDWDVAEGGGFMEDFPRDP